MVALAACLLSDLKHLSVLFVVVDGLVIFLSSLGKYSTTAGLYIGLFNNPNLVLSGPTSSAGPKY